MKYLSFILAFMVLILSTAPSCLREDRCIKPLQQKTQNHQQGKDGCTKCCSPFMNCNTCMGFVMNFYHFSIIHPVIQTEKKIALSFIKPILDFPYSVWHPPQLT